MHVVQTITALHDRYLSPPPNWQKTTTELHHLSLAASLFNKKLSSPMHASDRDAIWTTAALLGTVAFSWIEASKPEEAWPFTVPNASDLEWIRMSEQKAAVWNLTNPLRPDSIYHSLIRDYETLFSRKKMLRVDSIPTDWAAVYGLNDDSTRENNPYYDTVYEFLPLLQLECDRSTVFWFLSFISHLDLPFKKLLAQKDPRALLVFAYWYAKVRDSVWFLENRAVLEGQAICLYLEKFYPDETAIQTMLYYPKLRCFRSKTEDFMGSIPVEDMG